MSRASILIFSQKKTHIFTTCSDMFCIFLEVVSKRQIMFESPAEAGLHVCSKQINVCIKASRGLETERTPKYVSISIGGRTQLLEIIWRFEITSYSLNDWF